MSNSGRKNEQKSILNWALKLKNNSNICDQHLSRTLFDDEEFGIRIFCNPNSLICQYFKPEPCDSKSKLTIRQLNHIIYADEPRFTNVCYPRKQNDQFLWLKRQFITLHLLFASMRISTKFPRNQSQQRGWINALLEANPIDKIGTSLQEAHAKLRLLMKWRALSNGLSISDWKQANQNELLNANNTMQQPIHTQSLKNVYSSWFAKHFNPSPPNIQNFQHSVQPTRFSYRHLSTTPTVPVFVNMVHIFFNA
jgi:hypothetical protein